MSKQDLSQQALHPSLGLYRHRVLVPAGSELLFISGQLGVNQAGVAGRDLAEQADWAFANIARNLSAEGLTMDNVVKLTTYIVESQRGAPGVREGRLKYFGDSQPASTALYVSGLVSEDWLIEIEAIAARPPGVET